MTRKLNCYWPQVGDATVCSKRCLPCFVQYTATSQPGPTVTGVVSALLPFALTMCMNQPNYIHTYAVLQDHTSRSNSKLVE